MGEDALRARQEHKLTGSEPVESGCAAREGRATSARGQRSAPSARVFLGIRLDISSSVSAAGRRSRNGDDHDEAHVGSQSEKVNSLATANVRLHAQTCQQHCNASTMHTFSSCTLQSTPGDPPLGSPRPCPTSPRSCRQLCLKTNNALPAATSTRSRKLARPPLHRKSDRCASPS
jgi:hypothetical protein